MELVPLVSRIHHLAEQNEDDVVDRLSCRYTTAMLVLFAVIVSTKQYVGEPITCWTPAHFSKNQVEYADSHCWIRHKYFVSFDDELPPVEKRGPQSSIIYYQWVPLILLLQALLYYLPCVVWRTLNDRSGLDLGGVIHTAQQMSLSSISPEERQKKLNYMEVLMTRYLASISAERGGSRCTVSLKHLLSRTCFFFCGRRHGNYLITLYLIVKLLYVANAVGQLFLLDVLLGGGADFHRYGLDAIRALANGEEWTGDARRFPRVAMCDFNIWRLGNLQRYTLQCALPINLFNEKLFLFFWFWTLLVAVIAAVSAAVWSLRSALRIDRRRFVKNHLRLALKDQVDDADMNNFTDEYLREDGVFALRLIEHNTNAIAVIELMTLLWNNYALLDGMFAQSPPTRNQHDKKSNGHATKRLSARTQEKTSSV